MIKVFIFIKVVTSYFFSQSSGQIKCNSKLLLSGSTPVSQDTANGVVNAQLFLNLLHQQNIIKIQIFSFYFFRHNQRNKKGK